MLRAAFIVSVLGLIAGGLWLDHAPAINQTELFIAFHLASLSGIGLAVLSFWSRLQERWRRVVFIAVALVVWRITYFPLMVFAGWVATLGEWIQITTQILPHFIYPTFLLAMAIFHCLSAMAAGLLLQPAGVARPKRWFMYPAFFSGFAIAALVSFTSDSDMRILPDEIMRDAAIPQDAHPVANPYITALKQGGYTIPQQTLLIAAGSIYPAIPHTPWSLTVKGVLEAQFRHSPRASSSQRVEEHYLGFLSAHSRIACKNDCT